MPSRRVVFLLPLLLSILTVQVQSCRTVAEFQNILIRFGGDRNNLSDVPAHFLRGATGAGDWLSDVARPKTSNSTPDDETEKLKQKQKYETAVLEENPDKYLKFPELVKKYKYPVEEYEVTTEDGYILKTFRIPHSPKSPPKQGVVRPAVFLMHGLIDSSDGWIVTGPGKGLGYILADSGYDVWFGNARGNTYSKKHTSMNPDDDKFWQFSWEEIGLRDLPAMIDHALSATNQSKLYYIGHSQGTTSFFVMCSMRPEYNKKIRIMFALAPVAWMSHVSSPIIKLLSPITRGLDWVTKTLGIGEFLPSNQLLSIAGGVLCHDRAFTQDLCTNSLFIVCGFDQSQMNATILPVIMGHVPAGSSVRQLLHYGQEVMSEKFCRYDFGPDKNRKLYGVPKPPSYNVTKIDCPVSLIYSSNDWLSHPKDVDMLANSLGRVVEKFSVPHSRFNHLDYLWAVDVVELVYKKMLNTMKDY